MNIDAISACINIGFGHFAINLDNFMCILLTFLVHAIS